MMKFCERSAESVELVSADYIADLLAEKATESWPPRQLPAF